MIIKPLLNENRPIKNNFIKVVKEFEAEINKHLETNNNNTGKLNQICDNCELEFYYHNGTTYDKAIWIYLNNVNKLNIWIRVGISDNNYKKTNIYSECNLNCMLMSTVPSYALPVKFKKRGIFMSDKGKRVADVDYSQIIIEICNLTKCVCSAKCK